MRFEDSAARPPCLAIWLVTLFGPAEQGQAALGDLLEEFSLLRPKLGVPAAKRWFWRQTLRTIAYLVGRELRISPLTIAAVAIAGFMLRWYVSRLSNPTVTTAIDAVLQHYRVYDLDPHVYIFWTIHLMYAERFLVNALVGIIVGLVAKDREMAATISLALLGDLLAMQSMLMAAARTGDVGYLWTLPWSFAFSFTVVAGGAIVRICRSRSIRGLPH
jgi:hypothetical protein